MIQMIKKKFQIKLNQMKNMILKKMKKNFPNLLKNKLKNMLLELLELRELNGMKIISSKLIILQLI